MWKQFSTDELESIANISFLLHKAGSIYSDDMKYKTWV